MDRHKHRAIAGAFSATLVLVAGACASTVTPPPITAPSNVTLAKSDVPRASADPAVANNAALAIDAFGFELYRRIATDASTDDANIVISPASIAIALAMARAGARGETAAQMDAVLHSVGSDENAPALNALDQVLTGRSGSFRAFDGKDYELSLRIANAPFAQRDMKLQQAFLDALAARFGAGLRLVDYRGDPEAARRTINAWVDEQTEQRIPELLAPGVIDAAVRLVLVNAIYLKAPWATAFLAGATKPGQFHRLDGTTVEVPMMARRTTFRYAEGSGWRAVELPYVGDSLAMTVVVPNDLSAFEAALDTGTWGQLTGGLEAREVDLGMPRFKMETKADLAALLAALMPLAFDSQRADFSGITTEEQLFISNVIHQANISVDEKGTEAAAATAVVMRVSGGPEDSVQMRIDRPFLFAVRDVPTGAILFLGRVTDPS